MHHELQDQYDQKLRYFLEQRRTDRLRSVQRDDGRRQRKYGKRREDKQRPYDACGKKGLPSCKDKGVKPCHVHGGYAKHSYEECRANPCNQTDKARKNNTKNNNNNNNNKHAESLSP